MSEKVLCVDDDLSILASFRRTLRRQFHVETAAGAEEGLELLRTLGPFAVVVADMRMPGMNGIQFLREVRRTAPDTVRMMLTGNADQQTAINAVNEGHIFRFLTKPCPNKLLAASLEAGIGQYRMAIAERQLLEETLNGSITVLTDVLSLVNPVAFGRSARIRRYVKHVVTRLELPGAWQFEVAAMLSQIGCVTLPPETLEKHYAGQDLTDDEQEMLASHPNVGGKLIANIPRLGDVAHMIARQQEPFNWAPSSDEPKARDPVAVGGQLLKVVLDLDRRLSHGASLNVALARLRERPDEYDPAIVEALQEMDAELPASRKRTVQLHQLLVGMVLEQDVHAGNGTLLVTQGQEVTVPLLARLRRWAQGAGIDEPIRVAVPRFVEEQPQPAEELTAAAADAPT